MLWYQALESFGIKLIVQGMGEVTKQNAPSALCQINAMSNWLTPRVKNARQTRRERGQAYHGRLPQGLRFGLRPHPRTGEMVKDKSQIEVHPEEMSLLREMVLRIARGELRSYLEASVWISRVRSDSRPDAGRWKPEGRDPGCSCREAGD
jgi:hypothetical protein